MSNGRNNNRAVRNNNSEDIYEEDFENNNNIESAKPSSHRDIQMQIMTHSPENMRATYTNEHNNWTLGIPLEDRIDYATFKWNYDRIQTIDRILEGHNTHYGTSKHKRISKVESIPFGTLFLMLLLGVLRGALSYYVKEEENVTGDRLSNIIKEGGIDTQSLALTVVEFAYFPIQFYLVALSIYQYIHGSHEHDLKNLSREDRELNNERQKLWTQNWFYINLQNREISDQRHQINEERFLENERRYKEQQKAATPAEKVKRTQALNKYIRVEKIDLDPYGTGLKRRKNRNTTSSDDNFDDEHKKELGLGADLGNNKNNQGNNEKSPLLERPNIESGSNPLSLPINIVSGGNNPENLPFGGSKGVLGESLMNINRKDDINDEDNDNTNNNTGNNNTNPEFVDPNISPIITKRSPQIQSTVFKAYKARFDSKDSNVNVNVNRPTVVKELTLEHMLLNVEVSEEESQKFGVLSKYVQHAYQFSDQYGNESFAKALAACYETIKGVISHTPVTNEIRCSLVALIYAAKDLHLILDLPSTASKEAIFEATIKALKHHSQYYMFDDLQAIIKPASTEKPKASFVAKTDPKMEKLVKLIKDKQEAIKKLHEEVAGAAGTHTSPKPYGRY